MTDIYCLNGILKNRQQGWVDPYDRSFALGDGVFETVLARQGKPVWLYEHLERMMRSAAFAGVGIEFSRGEIVGQCESFLAEAGISEGFLRITLSRGATVSGRFSELPENGTLVITGGGGDRSVLPVNAGFADWQMNECDPAVYHKTTSRFSAVVASKKAKEKCLDEAVFLNMKGNVAEAIVSNIFWGKGGVLFTPAVACGLLPGITRGKVLQAAIETGIRVIEGEFGPEVLREADEIFFTNSLWLVRECKEFEGRRLSNFALAQTLLRHIERNL